MRLNDAILGGILCCSIAACGSDDSEGDRDDSTSEDAVAIGDDADGDGQSDDDGGNADDAEDGDTKVGVCSRYLECVRAATPQMLTVTIAAYGPEGTCWDLPGVTPEDCHTECQAHLDRLADAFPDVAECSSKDEEAGGDTSLADLSGDEYEQLCEELNAVLTDPDVAIGYCVASSIAVPGSDDCAQLDGFCRSITPPAPTSCAGMTPPDCTTVTDGAARECLADERTRFEEIATLGACDEGVKELLEQSAVCAKLRTECPQLFNGL